MKKTRNLLVLNGSPNEVKSVLDSASFKALSILEPSQITAPNINYAFECNKSVLCQDFNLDSINTPKIPILVTSNKVGLSPTHDCIDPSKDVLAQLEEIAKKHNIDIGDRKSNSSGLLGIPSKNDCVYCNYLKGVDTYLGRTIYENKYFFVMPSIGQFINGYLLIIPKAHVMSMAEFSKELIDEFNIVLEDVITILKLTYNFSDILVWENGTGNSGKGKAKDSVVHCHVHVAPSHITANKIEEISTFSLAAIKTNDIKNYNKHSYLLIKDGTDSWKINNNPSVYIPRQYVRQILADEYGIPGELWNWREYPYSDQVYKTVTDITTCLKNNWNKLSPRIKSNTKNFVKF